ncbi:L-threonylcarbamoyladenylate synthase [Pseudochelatococcus lubricantis]|uniref:Threonylcarbamoyl-AMP synthase n=1 Tax=Pseudochelatococcus lubricantis TaxID=1538102 RepID=A0ABX0V0P9_9HYPH|nr:L-threonylcarbamoyladenylate synthase [Pseudochelatococcus lubricantis]NIJ57845.1 L-threonylcarbamoyladenylate synthase [Pseudochelatococcus lubricantis]
MTARSDDSSTLLLPATPEGIARAAALLRAGRLVAFPTETVYGLGADATSGEAVAAIYAAKERPRFNPLIAHYPDVASAMRDGRFSDAARRLAQAFWPGPLTLVVPKSGDCRISDLASAGLDSVALRVPSHPVARALLAAAGVPVAAPSANRSGRVSPTSAAHVLGDLDGRIAAVIDGGETQVGVESTIVACLGERPVLLRPGGVPREAVSDVLGFAVDEPAVGISANEGAPVAPGQLSSHYAPRAAVRMHASDVMPGEAALLFGPPLPGTEQAAAFLNLSERGDLAEAAARLFAYLRALDRPGIDSIAVAPVPDTGLGEAINDRLRRAAAPRTA